MSELEVPGILTPRQVGQTAAHIASAQLPSGLIPWFPGHHADPWDHIEAAMALALGGLRDEARHAFEWCASAQSEDGSWPTEIIWRAGREHVQDASADANQCAYFAVGVWHYWRLTRDRSFVRAMWPTVRRAIDFVCDLQHEGGAISWARDPRGAVHPETLLTGSACMVLSLRCALALADLVNDVQPDWELSAARLAHAVAVHPDGFEDRSRYSMDWYYPILGGAVRGPAAHDLLASRWDEFVVPGRGVRCVADRPWVTAAETCELVLTLDALGDRGRALRLLRDIQFCRVDDGGYLTGWVFPEEEYWPEETSTWTAAAVLLAADAVTDHSPAASVFRATDLPPLLELAECDVRCPVRVSAGHGER